MTGAYLLLNCYTGNTDCVEKSLQEIDGVKEVSKVKGPYDFVVRVESDTYASLREIITWKIRKHDQISSTMTLMTEPVVLT